MRDILKLVDYCMSKCSGGSHGSRTRLAIELNKFKHKLMISPPEIRNTSTQFWKELSDIVLSEAWSSYNELWYVDIAQELYELHDQDTVSVLKYAVDNDLMHTWE